MEGEAGDGEEGRAVTSVQRLCCSPASHPRPLWWEGGGDLAVLMKLCQQPRRQRCGHLLLRQRFG